MKGPQGTRRSAPVLASWCAAALALALVGGCATSTEREVARIEEEIETYSERMDQSQALLAERYGAAREHVAAARERELLEQRGFRVDLLSRMQASRDRVVLQSLARMRRLVQSPERRAELQAQLSALESLYGELLETTKRLTGEMVAVRTAARDAQLEALSAELAVKRDALAAKRRRFVEMRRRRIAAVKGPGGAAAATAAAPAASSPLAKEGAEPAGTPAAEPGEKAASTKPPASADKTVAPAEAPAAPTSEEGAPAAPASKPAAPAKGTAAPADKPAAPAEKRAAGRS